MMWWQFFFCIAISIVLTSSKSPAQALDLSFPDNFEHAVVSVYRMPQPDEYLTGIARFSDDGEQLSMAKGSVRIPPGSWVSVEVAAEDGYEQFIASLPTSAIQDQAEQRALWNLQCLLERHVVEAFLPDYGELLARARDALRDDRS